MRIEVIIIDHKFQRYPTVGDWWWEEHNPRHDGPTLNLRVSKLSDPRYEQLVAIHELVEALVCRQDGVTTEMVDKWDKFYEQVREAHQPIRHNQMVQLECGCYLDATSEPGDDPHCPYYRQHQLATIIERHLAPALGVDWNVYEKEIESL